LNTDSDKVVRHSLVYLSVQKWLAGDVSYYVKMWPKPTIPSSKTPISQCPKFKRFLRNDTR